VNERNKEPRLPRALRHSLEFREALRLEAEAVASDPADLAESARVLREMDAISLPCSEDESR
jgi:hypothetical protein